MQGEISMNLSFCQSENGFFLDELIVKLAEYMNSKRFLNHYCRSCGRDE